MRSSQPIVILAALLSLIPFFQNCAPNFAVQSQFSGESVMSDPLAPKVMINIGSRSLAADTVVSGLSYTAVNNSVATLTYTSIPLGNCLRTTSTNFVCANPGTLSIKTDATASDKIAHEAVLTVISENSLTARGSGLYSTQCASCHGALASSQKRGRNLQQISDSMVSIPDMTSLSGLTPTDLIALKVALSGAATPTPTPAPTPTPTQAQALYQSKCSGCHGEYTSSSKRGRTAASISNAIQNNVGGMRTPSLLALTSTEIDMIVDALR